MSKTPREIVKEASNLYLAHRKKMVDLEGFYHPTMHGDGGIKKLIEEFEEVTGENWDETASSYLEQ